MKITWKQTEPPYEWEGTDEKENYWLVVNCGRLSKWWYWNVFRDEDKIIKGIFNEDFPATTADEAKARAEKALENYLDEQNNFTNTLREVLQVEKPTQLENEIEREMFYHQKP